VILVRDGDRNTVTMFNDFKGNTKDFAMVVPVPVVLKKSDIKVVDQSIFQTLNEYSKPRLVEYYDENPCELRVYDKLSGSVPGLALNDVVVAGYGRSKSLVSPSRPIPRRRIRYPHSSQRPGVLRPADLADGERV